MNNVEKWKLADALLEEQSTLTLASRGEHGTACASVFYLYERHQLYWFSSPDCEHSRNLRSSPEASVSIFQPTFEWKEIRGVQMKGSVSVVTSRELRREIIALYRRRFSLGRLFQPTILRADLLQFRPAWLRYMDNSRRFGFKFELRVSEDRFIQGEPPS